MSVRKSFRRGCIPFVLLVLPAIAGAQESGGATRGVDMFNQCAEITNDSERLSCFDRVTREMRATNRPAATATAPSATGPRQQSAQQQREDFGLDAPRVQEKRQQPAPIKQIKSRVAAVRYIGQVYWAILLEDGAIWKVDEFDRDYRPPRVGETVRVKRGALGGFLMYSGGQTSIRVVRLS